MDSTKYPYYAFNMLYCLLVYNLNLRIACLAQNNLGCESVHFEPRMGGNVKNMYCLPIFLCAVFISS